MNENKLVQVYSYSYSYNDFLRDCEILSEKSRLIDNFKWCINEIKTFTSFLSNMVKIFSYL
jgi:hypothetical protein